MSLLLLLKGEGSTGTGIGLAKRAGGITLPRPAESEAGNALVAIVSQYGDAPLFTDPSLPERLQAVQPEGPAGRIGIYVGIDDGVSDFTVSFEGERLCQGLLLSYSGTTRFHDVTLALGTSESTTIPVNGIKTSEPNERLIAVGLDSAWVEATPADGMTELADSEDAAGHEGLHVADQVQSFAGGSGQKNFTLETKAWSLGVLIALREHGPQGLLFDGRYKADFKLEGIGSLTEVSDPGGSGARVLKLTTPDSSEEEDPPRVQGLSPDLIENDDEIWLRTKFLIPEDFPSRESGWFRLLSIYGPPFEDSAPWGLSLDPDDNLVWQRNGTYSFDVPYLAPITKGEWIEALVHTLHSAEGFVEMWINGEPITFDFAEHNPNEEAPTTKLEMATRDASNNGGPNHGKILNYHQAGIFDGEDSSLYFGPLRIGTTLASVSAPWPTGHRTAVTREHVPDRLAVRIADPSAGASIARWAEDEAKAENVLANLTKSGEMSGGHKESALSLARDPRINFPDTGIYLDYFVEGAGGEDVWNGRVNQASKSDGDRMAVELKAVGHQAALQDRKALSLGFIDGDLSKWGDPSTQRRLKLIEESIDLVANTSVGFSSLEPESVLPGVINDFTNTEKREGHSSAGEAHYASSIDIGKVLYDYRQLTSFVKDANWNTEMALGTTDTFTTFLAGTDHDRTTALQQEVSASGASGYRFARLRDRHIGAEVTPLFDVIAWQNLKVLSLIAAQNLTLQGTWPNVGYTSGQLLRLAIPLYTYLEANEESVEDEGYVIQQAWYSDPGDMASVVTDLTKYELLRWYVMNGKLFEVRAPGTFGRRWQASAGPSELKETGEDGSRLWDRLVVSYQDVDGRTYTVGWPGSGADTESEQLIITDPDHPAVKAGKPREDLLALRGISTAERALEAGERWLKEGNELSHAGEAMLRGYVMDDKAVFRPVSQVQPGDHIQFDGTGYREIVAVPYDHDSRSASVTLDAPSDALQALLERYQAALSPLGL